MTDLVKFAGVVLAFLLLAFGAVGAFILGLELVSYPYDAFAPEDEGLEKLIGSIVLIVATLAAAMFFTACVVFGLLTLYKRLGMFGATGVIAGVSEPQTAQLSEK